MIAITYQGNRQLLPWGWEDAGPHAWRILRLLARHPDGSGKLKAMRLLTGLTTRQFNLLSPDEVESLAAGLPWLDGGIMREPIRNHFRIGSTRYYWPEQDFLDGQAMAYALADQSFVEYLTATDETARTTAARELLATLARPRKGMTRTPLTGVEEIEARAHRFRQLPPEWLLQAVLYWAAVRGKIDALYGDYLFRPSELDQEPTMKTPSFGWWSQFRFVAGQHVFGTVAQVEQSNFHEVCQYLMEKEGVRRANQVEMERIKRKSK